MSVQSNNQGRAYEYICLLTLNDEINKIRKAEIQIFVAIVLKPCQSAYVLSHRR